jgi:hypothetical protein
MVFSFIRRSLFNSTVSTLVSPPLALSATWRCGVLRHHFFYDKIKSGTWALGDNNG